MSADPHTRRQRLRAAVIGCGWIGAGEAVNRDTVGVQSHAEAYASHARTRLSAVVDANGEAAQKAAMRWNAETCFTDPAEMLRAVQPEIVSICTPDALHSSTIMSVLECPSVKAILAEKPLALTVAEAAHVSDAAARRGVVLSVNYSRRFCPAFRRLRAEIQGGGLGTIQQVHGYYCKGLVHNGTHWLDLLRFLFGETADARPLPFRAADADTPSVSLTLACGAGVVLQAVRTAAFTLFEMDILGEKGRLQILDSGHRLEYHAVKDSAYYAGYQNLAPTWTRGHCLRDAVVHAVDDLIGCLDAPGRSPLCTPQDAIACLSLATQMMEVVR